MAWKPLRQPELAHKFGASVTFPAFSYYFLICSSLLIRKFIPTYQNHQRACMTFPGPTASLCHPSVHHTDLGCSQCLQVSDCCGALQSCQGRNSGLQAVATNNCFKGWAFNILVQLTLLEEKLTHYL